MNSARARGHFRGDVFVVSDNEAYEREIDATVVSVEKPKDSLSAVSLKTVLFDMVDSATFDGEHSELKTMSYILLYLDADIQVNSRIDDFLYQIESFNPSCSAYMIHERWYAASTWNTGTMLLDRVHSSAFLREWNNLITEHHDYIRKQNLYSKDQWALMKLLEEQGHKYKVCELPNNAVSFAADFVTRYFWGAFGTTFTHFTSAKRESKLQFKHVRAVK